MSEVKEKRSMEMKSVNCKENKIQTREITLPYQDLCAAASVRLQPLDICPSLNRPLPTTALVHDTSPLASGSSMMHITISSSIFNGGPANLTQP